MVWVAHNHFHLLLLNDHVSPIFRNLSLRKSGTDSGGMKDLLALTILTECKRTLLVEGGDIRSLSVSGACDQDQSPQANAKTTEVFDS